MVGSRAEAPAVGVPLTRDGASFRPIVEVADGVIGIDITDSVIRSRVAAAQGVLLAHGDDAEGVTVGREGRTVRNRPATDEPIDEVGATESRPVELGQEDVRVVRQALSAQGVDAAAV